MKVEIPTPDGVAEAYVARPTGTGPWPGAILLSDAFGLREAMRAIAARIAALGYVVVVPDLFYRAGDYPPFDPKTVFAGPGPELDRLMKLIGSLDEAAAMRDTAAWLDFLDAHSDVASLDNRHGIFGYCMGGGLAIQTACVHPTRIAAAASLHGGRFLVAHTTPAIIAEKCLAAIYIGVAEIDRAHTAETTAALQAALTTAGVPHEIELYAALAHGWCVPDVPVFNAEGAERHYAKLGAFFALHLR